MRGIVDEDCEHWAEGKHRLVARFPIEEVSERLIDAPGVSLNNNLYVS